MDTGSSGCSACATISALIQDTVVRTSGQLDARYGCRTPARIANRERERMSCSPPSTSPVVSVTALRPMAAVIPARRSKLAPESRNGVRGNLRSVATTIASRRWIFAGFCLLPVGDLRGCRLVHGRLRGPKFLLAPRSRSRLAFPGREVPPYDIRGSVDESRLTSRWIPLLRV